jgi:type IV secretory pathway VirB4 component
VDFLSDSWENNAMPAPLVKQNAGNSLDLVDIKEIRGNVVIIKDGSLRQIAMVSGVNFALKSEDEQNLIVQAYQNFLNSIDFPLQIIIHSRKVNIDPYIEGLVRRKETEPSPLLQSQIDEYASFIKEFIEKNSIMEKTFLVVVPFYPTSTALTGTAQAASNVFSSLFGRKKPTPPPVAVPQADKETDRNFKENTAQLAQRMGQVVNGIASIGLETSILENQELVELFYNFYNPQTVERGAATASQKS